MYPQWLILMFRQNPCTDCKSALSLRDIEAVGVRCSYPDGLGRPLALVICVCGHCRNRMQCTVDQPMDRVLAAVQAFYCKLADAAPSHNGIFQLPSSEKPAGPARPSRRRNQPSAPPTEKEIKEFLARLKRMSFKAGSKGFGKLTGRRRRPGADGDGQASETE